MTKVIYKPFESIEEIKAKGEFFPKGRIVPRRICSVRPSKNQHKLTFNSDQWAFPTRSGYLVFLEGHDGGLFAPLKLCNAINTKINMRYIVFCWNDQGSRVALEEFNKMYICKNLPLTKSNKGKG